MTLKEAKKRAIMLVNEWSNNGILIGQAQNADYLNRLNSFADIAQKDIARIDKISSVYSISINPIPNQLGLFYGFDTKSKLDHEYIIESKGSQSYYFEVDNIATIYVEEKIGDTWTTLKTISNTIKGRYVPHKGIITPSSLLNSVRIRFGGIYPYNIRNTALFAYQFPSPEDVPSYVPYIRFELPKDFMELDKVVREYGQRVEATNFKWEGKRTISIGYYDAGSYDIYYFKHPNTIDDTTNDDYEFEVSPDAQQLIPLYMASCIMMDENPNLAIDKKNEYELKLSRIYSPDRYGITVVEDVRGW